MRRVRDESLAEQPRSFRPLDLTVFNNHLWLSRSAKDPQVVSYDLQDATGIVAPASSTAGAGSKNLLMIKIYGEDGAIVLKTAKEEDWPSLLEVLGPVRVREGMEVDESHRRFRRNRKAHPFLSQTGLPTFDGGKMVCAGSEAGIS